MGFIPTFFYDSEGKMDYDAFDRSLYIEMVGHENHIPTVYLDRKGIPTIGCGYALFDGGPGKYYLKKTIKQDFDVIGKAFTSKDIAYLKEICNILNKSGPQEVKKIFRSANVSMRITVDTVNGIPSESKRLFEHVIIRYKNEIKRRIGKGIYMKYQYTHQMIALISMVYNGGIRTIGPNMLQAIQNDDILRMWYELRYRTNPDSNADAQADIASRRYSESQQIIPYYSFRNDLTGFGGCYNFSGGKVQEFINFLNNPDPYESSKSTLDTIREYENRFAPSVVNGEDKPIDQLIGHIQVNYSQIQP